MHIQCTVYNRKRHRGQHIIRTPKIPVLATDLDLTMSKVTKTLVVLSAILCVALSAPSDDIGDKFLPIVLAEAKKIPIENYEADPALQQKVDKLNEISRYEDPFNDEVLYERSADDTGKDVLVISPNENTIGNSFGKHTYVVLRLSPFKLKIPRYYVSLAYILYVRCT